MLTPMVGRPPWDEQEAYEPRNEDADWIGKDGMSPVKAWSGDDRELAQIQRNLVEAHGFLPSALPANRDGRLTDDQKRLLAHGERMVRLVSLCLALVVIVGTGSYLLAQLAEYGLSTRNGQWIPALWLLLAAIVVFIERRWRRIRGELDAGEVHAVSYRANPIRSESSDSINYGYDFGVMRFDVTEEQYQAMAECPVYRCFYRPHSHILVNMETLGAFESQCGAEQLAHIP